MSIGEEKEFDIHPKIIEFSNIMQHEIKENDKKGNWEEFQDKELIFSELYHHLNKLESAYINENILGIKEHIADCANILLMLGNSYNLY